MTYQPQPVPVWHVQGDRQTEIGSATVSFDQDTGEATITLVGWEESASGMECFLVVETPADADGLPSQVLAFTLGDYHLAGMEEYPTQVIPLPPEEPPESP